MTRSSPGSSTFAAALAAVCAPAACSEMTRRLPIAGRRGVQTVDVGRAGDAAGGQRGVDLGGRHRLVDGAAQVEGADGERVDAQGRVPWIAHRHPTVGGPVVGGDLGLQRAAKRRARQGGSVAQLGDPKARVTGGPALGHGEVVDIEHDARPSSLKAPAPSRRPRRRRAKRPSSDSGWLARSPFALTSPLAAPLHRATPSPTARACARRSARVLRSLSSAASLSSVPIAAEADVARDLGRAAEFGLEEIELRQLERRGRARRSPRGRGRRRRAWRRRSPPARRSATTPRRSARSPRPTARPGR